MTEIHRGDRVQARDGRIGTVVDEPYMTISGWMSVRVIWDGSKRRAPNTGRLDKVRKVASEDA